MNQLLIEMTVYYSGATHTHYYSTHGYTSLPTDTPANTFYEPRIQNPGSLKMMMFSDGTTSGASQIGWGDVTFTNTDGGLDFLLNAGFSGREIMLKELVLGGAVLIMSCSMEQPTFDSTSMSVRIKDPQIMLNVPVQPNKYGGTNSLPAGVDGVADIEGKPKPLLYGQCSNVTPVCVNTSRLIYQLHDGGLQAISNVYDKGVALIAGAAYTTAAEVQANPPSAGEYRVYLAGGMFRLGSSPVGLVTADAVQGATAADRTAAQIAKTVALKAITSGDLVAGDFTSLDTLNSVVVGIYIPEETLIPAVLDEVLGSISAWYAFDSAGLLNVGRLDAPSGTPAVELTSAEMLSLDRGATQDEGRGLPAWKVNLGYDKNFTVQSPNELGGRITNTNMHWESVTMPQSGSWSKIAHGAGKYMAPMGGATKKVAMSDDGFLWYNVADLPYNVSLPAVAYGAGLWVVTDWLNGYIFTTTDGGTWTQRTHGLSGIIDIVFGGDTFIALSSSGTGVATSTTGTSWTTYGTLPTGTNRGITWGELDGVGCFLAVKRDGAVFATSTDKGATWTTRTAPSSGNWGTPAAGGGVFVVCSSAYDDYRIAVSKDNGVTWTQRILKSGTGYGFEGIVYGNEGFIISGGPSYSSIDGDIWASFLVTYGYLTAGSDQYIVASTSSSATIQVYSKYMPAPRTQYLSKEYRTVTDTDSAIKTMYLSGAQELNVNTLIVSAADAQTEATRILNLRKVRRDYIAVKVKRSALSAVPDLGKIIEITYPRYGYDAGKLFVLIGFELFLESDDLTLHLWG